MDSKKRNAYQPDSTEVNRLVEKIKSLSGNKIVTIVTPYEQQEFDIAEDGTIGYDSTHIAKFMRMILEGMQSGGGVIIRQFLTTTFPHKGKDNVTRLLPEKNIYGVHLGNTTWSGMSAEEVQWAHTMDAQTGQSIEPEPGVYFCSFT